MLFNEYTKSYINTCNSDWFWNINCINDTLNTVNKKYKINNIGISITNNGKDWDLIID